MFHLAIGGSYSDTRHTCVYHRCLVILDPPLSSVQRSKMEKQERKKKAIVIGAGVGGTATAARLACAGFDVDVYEKNEFSGGRCSLIRHEGYRFDQVRPSLHGHSWT